MKSVEKLHWTLDQALESQAEKNFQTKLCFFSLVMFQTNKKGRLLQWELVGKFPSKICWQTKAFFFFYTKSFLENVVSFKMFVFFPMKNRKTKKITFQYSPPPFFLPLSFVSYNLPETKVWGGGRGEEKEDRWGRNTTKNQKYWVFIKKQK